MTRKSVFLGFKTRHRQDPRTGEDRNIVQKVSMRERTVALERKEQTVPWPQMAKSLVAIVW